MNEWERIKPDLREWLRSLPTDKVLRRENKRYRILYRQVRRAGRYPDQAPPLLHNGKAWR